MNMELNAREKIVLEAIIRHFVEHAEPVGSKLLTKLTGLNLSSASIRTVMARLEKTGLIRQPHISAGRIPTALGYRVYVDALMKRAKLSATEKDLIFRSLKTEGMRLENILEVAARLLANISHQLTILVSPGLDDSIFEKIEIMPLSGRRVVLIMSISSGFIKTMNLEIEETVNERDLRELTTILNERLSGLTISMIRHRFRDILKGVSIDKYGILKLFIRDPHKIFHFDQDQELLFNGAIHLLEQPEFKESEKAAAILSLLEHKNPIVKLIDDTAPPSQITRISIGDEIPLPVMKDFSIVTSRYLMGDSSGSISVVGPMRMNYPKLVAVVEYTARAITDLYRFN